MWIAFVINLNKWLCKIISNFIQFRILCVDNKSHMCSWLFTYKRNGQIKKAEPSETYFQSEAPPSTLHINKYEQFTPIERKLSVTYPHVLRIGGFQIERIRAKSSSIFLISIWMETLFQKFIVLNKNRRVPYKKHSPLYKVTLITCSKPELRQQHKLLYNLP